MKYLFNCLKSVPFTGLLLIIYYSISTVQAIDIIDPGRAMAAQCSQCHGMEGNKYEGLDSLKGEDFDKIYNELWEMVNSADNDLMVHQAKGYTEDDIMLLANYFAAQADAEDIELE